VLFAWAWFCLGCVELLPLPKGSETCSSSSDLALCLPLSFDCLLEFLFIHFFSFYFLSGYYMCVLSMHSSKGRLRTMCGSRAVDGRFLMWWVIDNVVWTDSWLRRVQVAAWFVLVQVNNDRERSSPVRPPGVEKTSRLGSRDPVASGAKCGPHGGKNSRTKSWTVSWCSIKT
jgi:hypothetical protein